MPLSPPKNVAQVRIYNRNHQDPGILDIREKAQR